MTLLDNLLDLERKHIIAFEDLVNAENKYGCVDGKIIGTGRSDYTVSAEDYDLSINGKTFTLIDIPGIEGNESKFEEIISSSLDRSHIIFYINGSGKKIEKATLEKIKKYMHDGTSVYTIFNVHCKPKKERIPDIDGTYSEELREAYSQSADIIRQTEKELKSFLGANYKGSVCVNGLLSFCGLALDANGATSIVYDKNKALRSDQKKYLKEYEGSRDAMLADSRISEISEIITDKVSRFDKYIYDENIKKLKNRLTEMTEKVRETKENYSEMINKISGDYLNFESNCRGARDEYIHSLRQIGYHAASDAFSDIKEELFDMIERDGGKTKAKTIQQYFDDHKNQITEELQKSLNQRMENLKEDYINNINEAVERLVKDFDRDQIIFKVSLSSQNMSIDDSFAAAFKYNWKSFGKDFLEVASLALSGFAVGNAFLPVIGGIIGAAAGALLGVLSSIWNFFANEATRINRAKEKLQHTIDEQIESVDSEIRQQIENLDFESKINDSYEKIRCQIDRQRKMLNNINKVLDKVESELTKTARNYK